MAIVPRRLRRPGAELRIESQKITPPDETSGGVVCLRVSLLPLEPFDVSSARLELSSLTTRYSRTTLDGYLEHTSRELHHAADLSGFPVAEPGVVMVRLVELVLPRHSISESRPAKLQWLAEVRFAIARRRDLHASLLLPVSGTPSEGAPVVDGRGFLPLYEFRTTPRS